MAVAILFLVVERVGPREARTKTSLTPGEALAIGVAQAAALVPGVSRSGATITAGMFLGLRREAAARFSFLLGVPAILAAAAHEGPAAAGGGSGPRAGLAVRGWLGRVGASWGTSRSSTS